MIILKSIGAVFVGFIAVVVLSILTDTILERAGIFPPPSDQGLFVTWMLALALFYRSIYTFVGGYVTAWLAPTSPIKHVYVLAFIGFLAGIGGVVAGWNLSQHWYPIALAITGPVFVWWGGKLRLKKI